MLIDLSHLRQSDSVDNHIRFLDGRIYRRLLRFSFILSLVAVAVLRGRMLSTLFGFLGFFHRS